MTVNSGRCSARFAGSFSGRNMFRANRLCHANSLTMRIGSRNLAIGARPRVEDVQLLVLQIRHHVPVQRVERGVVERLVARRPSARAARSTSRGRRTCRSASGRCAARSGRRAGLRPPDCLPRAVAPLRTGPPGSGSSGRVPIAGCPRASRPCARSTWMDMLDSPP